MAAVYLLLGSNESDRPGNLGKARNLIEKRAGKITLRSSLYETEAWGLKEQNPFLNQALAIDSNIPSLELLSILKDIEKEVGRVETIKWGPRVIDIDILFYGDKVVSEEHLKIPHPYLHERRFTLEPLNEIAPDFIHPSLGQTVNQLLAVCADNSKVNQLP